jgi:hypothetical protein
MSVNEHERISNLTLTHYSEHVSHEETFHCYVDENMKILFVICVDYRQDDKCTYNCTIM